MNQQTSTVDREATPTEDLRDFILANHVLDRPVDKERMEKLIVAIREESWDKAMKWVHLILSYKSVEEVRELIKRNRKEYLETLTPPENKKNI